MFIAALLDARPDLTAGTVEAIRSAGVPDDWTVGPMLRSGRLGGDQDADRPPAGCLETGARHYEYAGILRRACARPLWSRACVTERWIISLIAQAEAEVHGVALTMWFFTRWGRSTRLPTSLAPLT